MPITDTNKKHIAQQRRLFINMLIVQHPMLALRCRKCHGKHMRLKKDIRCQEVGRFLILESF
jgi:hypothetical protein